MKVKILKYGNFAFHPVTGPYHFCIVGDVVDLPNVQAEKLIKFGWAEPVKPVVEVKKKEPPPVIEEAEKIGRPPWTVKGWDPNAPDAKQKLSAFCEDVYEESLDKRKSVQSLIKDTKKLIRKYKV